MQTIKNRQRGFTLISMAVWAIALFGVVGLSVDVGRLFINKNESQSFSDAAALRAARQLDSTSSGLQRAREAAAMNANRWDFGTRNYGTPLVEFSHPLSPADWYANPPATAGYTRVRVSTAITQNLYFIPVIVQQTTQLIRSTAVAEQVKPSKWVQGLFPFSPLAFHNVGPHFGLIPGQMYTMRYPSSDKRDACQGDKGSEQHASVGPERGWWGDNSTTLLRRRILADYHAPGEAVIVGQPLPATGGARTTASRVLDDRVELDTDDSANNYPSYLGRNDGNGRRLVLMPISDPLTGVVYGIGRFFLPRAGNYNHSGNAAWCAEYLGNAGIPGSPTPGAGEAGAYEIRLSQ